MPRYFIELGYKGTAYSGFQAQQNANTIQAEVEKALTVYFRDQFELTGSSRTDTGVHAIQNYFHFDSGVLEGYALTDVVYHLNAILPTDIVIHTIRQVHADAHCRFDAIARTYRYSLYRMKNPFLEDRSFHYPFPLDMRLMNEAAALLMQNDTFESFSKRNTQVSHHRCRLSRSEWIAEGKEWVYYVCGDRFLRGMVRGMVGTMLRVGRNKMSIDEFQELILSRKTASADFSVPGLGLMLIEVKFPEGYFH